MTPPTRPMAAVAVACALGLALPGAAGAHASPPGSLTFQQTFPLASSLCAKVAAGTENKHLRAHAVQVTADCAALQATFTVAQTTVVAARAALLPQLAADRAAVRAACPNPKVVRAACRKAHKLDDAAIVSILHQLHAARHAYYKSVEAARRQFWAAIKSLPHEHHAKADLPITVPPA